MLSGTYMITYPVGDQARTRGCCPVRFLALIGMMVEAPVCTSLKASDGAAY